MYHPVSQRTSPQFKPKWLRLQWAQKKQENEVKFRLDSTQKH